MTIWKFRGKYDFLSNFYLQDLKYDEDIYHTAEHAFQAAKCRDRAEKQRVMNAKTSALAKQIGRRIKMKSNWEQIKVSVMEEILKAKFSDEKLCILLNQTKGKNLIEGNYWHDQFWGSCLCTQHINIAGKNMLGILLMKLRDVQ